MNACTGNIGYVNDSAIRDLNATLFVSCTDRTKKIVAITKKLDITNFDKVYKKMAADYGDGKITQKTDYLGRRLPETTKSASWKTPEGYHMLIRQLSQLNKVEITIEDWAIYAEDRKPEIDAKQKKEQKALDSVFD